MSKKPVFNEICFWIFCIQSAIVLVNDLSYLIFDFDIIENWSVTKNIFIVVRGLSLNLKLVIIAVAFVAEFILLRGCSEYLKIHSKTYAKMYARVFRNKK